MTKHTSQVGIGPKERHKLELGFGTLLLEYAARFGVIADQTEAYYSDLASRLRREVTYQGGLILVVALLAAGWFITPALWRGTWCRVGYEITELGSERQVTTEGSSCTSRNWAARPCYSSPLWNAADQTRAYRTALASRVSRKVRLPGWLDSVTVRITKQGFGITPRITTFCWRRGGSSPLLFGVEHGVG